MTATEKCEVCGEVMTKVAFDGDPICANKQCHFVDYGDGNGLVHYYDEDGKAVEHPCPDCGLVTVLGCEGGTDGPTPTTWCCVECHVRRILEDDSPKGRKVALLTDLVLGVSDKDLALANLESTWEAS